MQKKIHSPYSIIKNCFIIVFLLLICLYVLILVIALWSQKNIHNNYNSSYNGKRNELGVYPIENFEAVDNTFWEDLYPDNPVKRWQSILTNSEIANTVKYTNSERSERAFHQSKELIFSTQLFFWQNCYAGEFDVFINPIDTYYRKELRVFYFSSKMKPGNYFYAQLDSIDTKPTECRVIVVAEYPNNDLLKGNITKEEADKLLIEWGIR